MTVEVIDVMHMVEAVYQLLAELVTNWQMVDCLPYAKEEFLWKKIYHKPVKVCLPLAIYHMSTSPLYTLPKYLQQLLCARRELVALVLEESDGDVEVGERLVVLTLHLRQQGQLT